MVKKLAQALPFYLSIPFIYSLSLLPLSWLYTLSQFVFFVFYKILKYRRAVVYGNIQRSFPEKTEAEHRELEYKFYKTLSDYVVETLKSFTISGTEILKKGRIVPNVEMDALAAANRNIIISAGHVVNQELANLFLAQSPNFRYTVKAAYHSLANRYFDAFFYKSRSRFGTCMYSMKESYSAVDEQDYKRPFAFFLLNDQSAPPHRAYWTRFLGQETSFYKGMAVFAQKYDMPVFYAHFRPYGRGNFELEFVKICDQPKLVTEAEIIEPHVQLLEKNIRAYPHTWLWSHKRWKHQRPTETEAS
jgi:Kdo2-lipid IVA lauroyltransferase/acyltransferase